MFCRLYCNEIPEEVDKCERSRPQLIRVSRDVVRTYHFKIFDTECYDNNLDANEDYATIIDTTVTQHVATNNYPTTALRISDIMIGEYRIVKSDETLVKYGTFKLVDNLFDLRFKIEERGFYRLYIYYRKNEDVLCSCLFPINVS